MFVQAGISDVNKAWTSVIRAPHPVSTQCPLFYTTALD